MFGALAMSSWVGLCVALAPQDAGVVSFTQVTINHSAGDQYDPHVDGTLAAYSNDTPIPEIRYFNFASSVDSAISNVVGGGHALDLLSDVDQGRIAFTRLFPDSHSSIMLFDTATSNLVEIAPSPGSQRLGVALGSQTLAFIDRGVESNGELVVYDVTSGTSTRLTNDTDVDNFPSVSPDGAVVTWEHCTPNCNVWRAVKGGSGWVVTAIAPSAEQEHNPDASPTQIVYEATRAASTTGPNLYVSPVAGGAELELAIPGEEYNPSIRGNIIAFEHVEPGQVDSDLYVYELTTNRIFQLTNTPRVDETLNDVTILADGSIRVVWAANDDLDGVSRNIYGATFSLPPVGPVCQNRTASLTASRDRRHGSDGTASFSPAFGFAIPAQLSIVSGSTDEAEARLTITDGSQRLECWYRSPRTRRHSHPDHLNFEGCAGRHAPKAGAIVRATSLRLHLEGEGCDHGGGYAVKVALSESCATPVWPTEGQCSGHRHDDDDRDLARLVGSGLDTVSSPETEAAGCSSTGGLLWPALLALLAIWARRRA